MRHWSYTSVLIVALATEADPIGAAEPEASSDPPQPPATRQLDLRIPPITEIFTPEQISVLLAGTRDPDMDEVEVEGQRGPLPPKTPTVWGGIFSIFAPVSSDGVEEQLGRSLRARAFYIEPAARTALDL